MDAPERLSQYERALLGLRSLVLEGAVEPEARLPEVTLSERLGLSRTPLRQAMDRLVDEGLLERLPAGGCRVARFTIQDVTDAIELRGVIEGMAARLAAERGARPEKLDEGAALLADLDEALARGVDFDAYFHLNARFHDLLAELPESPVIRREAERVHRLPLASPSAFLRGQAAIPDFRASLLIAQAQHHAILDAISAREGARAEALAREHARLARRNLDHLTRADRKVAADVPGLALVSVGVAED